MNPEDPNEILAQLRDIRLPSAPPAEPVWDIALAAFLLLAGLSLLAWAWWRGRVKPENQVIERLRSIDTSNPDQARAEMAIVIKGIALHDEPGLAQQSANDDYLPHLDRLFNTDFFSTGAGVMFGTRLYQPVSPDFDAEMVRDTLIRLAQNRSPRRR